MPEPKKMYFERPVLLKQEKYKTEGNKEDHHCHQVKEECSPKQAKA